MPRFGRRMRGRVGKGYARSTRGGRGGMRSYQARYGLAGSSLMNSLARVHQFKRVGVPMEMVSAPGNVIPTLVNAAGPTVPFLQIGNYSNTTLDGGSQFGGAFSFQLAQCAAYAEITNLFDNYRIVKVELRFDYSANSAPGAVGTGYAGVTAIPLMHVAPDYDDNAIPAAEIAVLQNGYCKTVRLDKPYTITLKPRAQSAVATGAAALAVGGQLPSYTWIDNDATAVPHYGVKFWIKDFAVTAAGVGRAATLRVVPTYYLEAKNVI